MDDSELLDGLESKLNQSSDVGKAMEEFFKDKADENDESHHSIDLRSRLVAKSVKGHSVINFLSSIIVAETKDKVTLAEGLGVLSISLKRHALSHEGKSRQEIISLFQAQSEAMKHKANFNIFQPQGSGIK